MIADVGRLSAAAAGHVAGRFQVDATNGAGGIRAPWRGSRSGRSRPSGSAQDLGAAGKARALYGAVDLGTNNCRLLIAAPRRDGFTVVDAFSRIVRLGEGLSTTGLLNEEAMSRTIDALRVCANKLTWNKVYRRRLVATEACRMARNGPEFIARVAAETGLALEIIDREIEAGLAAAGAEPLIEEGAEKALVFDIGGGSTELIWVERKDGAYVVSEWTSIAAGVVTISERFGGIEVTPSSYQAMREFLRPYVTAFRDTVGRREGSARLPHHLLGTSGTVTTIAGVQLGLKRYDRSRVDGCWLESQATSDVTARLLAMSYDERRENPCIGHDRADLVLAGCAILEEICMAFPADRIRVADRGLREGMLATMMREDGAFAALA
jgi:exopolyphosphatase / guanosine-5'-triphosphate,3'-diphosphate pyrophosphatase